ncbi:MAG: LptE family protein [PVC group bacterium]
MNKFLFLLIIVAAVTVVILAPAGCGPYRLGTTLPPHLQTVYVPTFENTTFEPGIEVDVTDAVITRFRQDGNLRPVSRDQADTVLEGEITGWNRRVLDYTGEEENEVEEYRLYVTAVITFRELATGETLVSNQRVRGYTDFYLEGDLPTAEEDARPRAFKDLARRIVDQVVSIW